MTSHCNVPTTNVPVVSHPKITKLLKQRILSLQRKTSTTARILQRSRTHAPSQQRFNFQRPRFQRLHITLHHCQTFAILRDGHENLQQFLLHSLSFQQQCPCPLFVPRGYCNFRLFVNRFFSSIQYLRQLLTRAHAFLRGPKAFHRLLQRHAYFSCLIQHVGTQSLAFHFILAGLVQLGFGTEGSADLSSEEGSEGTSEQSTYDGTSHGFSRAASIRSVVVCATLGCSFDFVAEVVS
mmetsp:Transcript_4712/g.8441  ORF Transcript_4712/g.8441 Transcript_4712/m.8441 type:complete len:237 (+) Transcript_4712:110-820(+)